MASETSLYHRRMKMLHQMIAASNYSTRINSESTVDENYTTYTANECYSANTANTANTHHKKDSSCTAIDNSTAGDYYAIYSQLVGYDLKDADKKTEGATWSQKPRKGRKFQFVRIMKIWFCCGWRNTSKEEN